MTINFILQNLYNIKIHINLAYNLISQFIDYINYLIAILYYKILQTLKKDKLYILL